MDILYRNIKARREELGMSQDELAKKLGYKSRSSINKIELGINDLPQSKIAEFACALDTTPTSLMGWDRDILGKDRLIERVLTRLPYFPPSVSAGSGQWLSEGTEYEFEDYEDVPSGSDFVLRVCGNSMEPLYVNGDKVFIKTSVLVESGQVGIFYLNGSGYLKMLQGNKLISLNPDYEPIQISGFDEFFCAGRVLGKVKQEGA